MRSKATADAPHAEHKPEANGLHARSLTIPMHSFEKDKKEIMRADCQQKAKNER
jgi:hypothetical protein